MIKLFKPSNTKFSGNVFVSIEAVLIRVNNATVYKAYAGKNKGYNSGVSILQRKHEQTLFTVKSY